MTQTNIIAILESIRFNELRILKVVLVVLVLFLSFILDMFILMNFSRFGCIESLK